MPNKRRFQFGYQSFQFLDSLFLTLFLVCGTTSQAFADSKIIAAGNGAIWVRHENAVMFRHVYPY